MNGARDEQLPLAWMCGLALLASLALGGGTKTFEASDVFAEALCLPILIVGLVALARGDRPASLAVAMAVAGLCLALPLVQLIPLPPAVWTKLPGREAIANGYRLAGVAAPWLGISLEPAATRQSLLSLIPPLTVFVTAVQLTLRERRRVLAMAIGFTLFSIVIALLQFAQGSDSALQFYHPGIGSVNGLFSNRNHFAALEYTIVLIVTAWAMAHLIDETPRSATRSRRLVDNRNVTSVLLLLALATILFGSVLSQSRAGFILAIAATVLGVAIVMPRSVRSAAWRPAAILSVAIAAVVIMSVNFYLYQTLQRVQTGFADSEQRELVWKLVRPVLSSYFPVGSGFGTFVPAFQAQELPAQALTGYVNRAHNEYLEWGIEGGFVAYALLALAGAWLVWLNVRIWLKAEYDTFVDECIAKACALAPFLLLLHSSVDYPLRTVALSAVTALCVGYCIEPTAIDRAGATPAD